MKSTPPIRIKVCGMREPANIQALSALPIDMLGFIFSEQSPRYVPDNALALQPFPDGIERVGVFVQAGTDTILEKVRTFPLDHVQLHGGESPEFCRILRDQLDQALLGSTRIIKAFGVDETFDFSTTDTFTRFCSLFLFDTRDNNTRGGTGRRFDWELLLQYQGERPFILSGGIGPETLPALRAFHHPMLYGIDLNSRFEIRPGYKDVDQIRRFIHPLKHPF